MSRQESRSASRCLALEDDAFPAAVPKGWPAGMMGAQSLWAWLLPEELTPETALELSLLVTCHALG